MLHQVGRQRIVPAPQIYLDRLIFDRPAQGRADDLGNSEVIHLRWTVQRIRLASVRGRVSKNRRNEPSLVFRRDRGVPPMAEWKGDDAALYDRTGDQGVQKILRKEGGPQM